MSTTAERVRELVPVSMEAAVGYPAIDCYESTVEGALVLKHDRLFLLVNGHGDIAPPGRCGLGLFHDDTRILSHYALTFVGGPPSLLSTQVPHIFSAQVDLAATDLQFGGTAWDTRNSVHIRREVFLGDTLLERVTLASYRPVPIDYWMELSVGCDFADIFEVRGWQRPERGQFYAPRTGERSITFAYRGRDGELIGSTVRFREPPSRLHARGAGWEMRLEPGRTHVLEWEVVPGFADEDEGPWEGGGKSVERRRTEMEALCDAWRDGCSAWRTDVEEFDTTLSSAVDDLRALHVSVDGEAVISAGIPWYSTVFGRDSIITSLQTLPLNPRIAVDTLRYLARHQGEREDPFTEEQPGRIMHELRRGEMARAREIPHLPYYGTIDATPLWLVLLHETWRWTGDGELVRQLLPHAERALRWIDEWGDPDGDGFVEYARTSEKGLVNQGWKDSGDGVPFPDGSLPEPPIALVEVQGYVYDAKRRMALLFDAFGRPDEAERLRREAEALREAIIRHFWLPELGTFALALDGDKRPLATATTNAAHLLWSRVPGQEHADRMARQLLSPEMFSGWGIRTLSAAHPVFNPMSYHDGSVWPHDNAIVALGLALYGHTRAALPVLTALHETAPHMPSHRLPELFCGMQRAHGMRPVLYPVSCSPQAWASGSLFMLLQAVLGILPDAPAGVLHVRAPLLPRFLRKLELRGLRVGGSRVDLQFRRHRHRTLANLLAVEGEPLRVVIELS
jgi:glycogen debranching enzyme